MPWAQGKKTLNSTEKKEKIVVSSLQPGFHSFPQPTQLSGIKEDTLMVCGGTATTRLHQPDLQWQLKSRPQLFCQRVLILPVFVFPEQALMYIQAAYLKNKKATAVEIDFSWGNSESIPCGQGLGCF